jgi:hypothetical protein
VWFGVRMNASIQQHASNITTTKKTRLSSKAGGCGLNIVGANRLVLFDPVCAFVFCYFVFFFCCVVAERAHSVYYTAHHPPLPLNNQNTP